MNTNYILIAFTAFIMSFLGVISSNYIYIYQRSKKRHPLYHTKEAYDMLYYAIDLTCSENKKSISIGIILLKWLYKIDVLYKEHKNIIKKMCEFHNEDVEDIK